MEEEVIRYNPMMFLGEQIMNLSQGGDTIYLPKDEEPQRFYKEALEFHGFSVDNYKIVLFYPPEQHPDPISQLSTPQPSIDEKVLKLLMTDATVALKYYNSLHQCHFELVDVLYLEQSSAFWEPSRYHLSFIARSEDTYRKIKLFFAEVCSNQVVNICCPVEPDNPLYTLGCKTCNPEGVIYHPLGICQSISPYARKLEPLEESAKKKLFTKYSLISSIQELYPEEEKFLREAANRYAKFALQCYTRSNKIEYELLEVVASVRFCDRRAIKSSPDFIIFAHLFFMARKKDSHCASPELFFAEHNVDFNSCIAYVNMTQTGYDPEDHSEGETSCKACRECCKMVHPEGKYVAGITEGIFADALVKDQTLGAKVELQEKEEVGTSSNAASVECSLYDIMHLRLESEDNSLTCLANERSLKKTSADVMQEQAVNQRRALPSNNSRDIVLD